jgi:putative endonuclease
MYILECADETYFTRSMWNLDKRFQEHQRGEGANNTSHRLPLILVYYEELDRVEEKSRFRAEAMRRRRH